MLCRRRKWSAPYACMQMILLGFMDVAVLGMHALATAAPIAGTSTSRMRPPSIHEDLACSYECISLLSSMTCMLLCLSVARVGRLFSCLLCYVQPRSFLLFLGSRCTVHVPYPCPRKQSCRLQWLVLAILRHADMSLSVASLLGCMFSSRAFAVTSLPAASSALSRAMYHTCK